MLKEVKDYIPELQKKFPYLCKKDIKTIVDYGWRALYYYTLFGCDTLVTKQGFWCYIGFLTKDSFKHFNYYIKKLCRKIKMIYRKNKGIKDWDGYFYIGLNEEEYTLFKKSRTQVGRKRIHYEFKKKMSYRLLDEAKLKYSWSRCIIKYRSYIDRHDSYYSDILKCDKPEIVLEREHPCTFKDILVSTNTYDNL